MSKKGTGKLILGAGLGAGLALLFAPKKGSELREDLKCKINELVNKAKEVDTEEVKENLEKLMMNTSMLSKDLGTVLVGEDAVMAGLVNEVGGIDKAYQKLRGLMNK